MSDEEPPIPEEVLTGAKDQLEDGGPSGAMQPIFPFDRIEMHIDYPLIDSIDTTPASA